MPATRPARRPTGMTRAEHITPAPTGRRVGRPSPSPPDAAGPPGAALAGATVTAAIIDGGVRCEPAAARGEAGAMADGRQPERTHRDQRRTGLQARALGRPGAGDDPDPQRRPAAAGRRAGRPGSAARSSTARSTSTASASPATGDYARGAAPRPASSDDAFVWLGLHEPDRGRDGRHRRRRSGCTSWPSRTRSRPGSGPSSSSSATCTSWCCAPPATSSTPS